jgi:virulence-associated protein VapD
VFAITFDLVVKDVEKHHPSGYAAQAYTDIRDTLKNHGFDWIQGSVYINPSEDLAGLYSTISDLKALKWFPHSVRDVRAFRVEQWSDFTNVVKLKP